jgi:HEPN domain-containing protein
MSATDDGPDRAQANAARAWLAKADSDLLNIENNLVAHAVPWDTVCFHAHQAAEKSLKAVLVARGQSPARTHDLLALLAECMKLQPGLVALQNDCALLNVYAVASRYPGTGIEPDRAVGAKVVAAAQRAADL